MNDSDLERQAIARAAEASRNAGRAAAEAIRDKRLDFTVALRQITEMRMGRYLVIRCWCGRSVEGDVSLVRRAHRRHLETHEAPS